MMKKMMCLFAALMMCLGNSCALAGSWTVPGGGAQSPACSYSGYGMQAVLIEDLATRSGPSTTYTGCGSYKMRGTYVRVISRAFDNGGVQWAQVEFAYGGALRRAYTGVKRLSLSQADLARIPEEDLTRFIGYGTLNTAVNPKYGPGTNYATYSDRTMGRGTQVAVISAENGYYQVECYYNNAVFRSWIPTGNIDLS